MLIIDFEGFPFHKYTKSEISFLEKVINGTYKNLWEYRTKSLSNLNGLGIWLKHIESKDTIHVSKKFIMTLKLLLILMIKIFHIIYYIYLIIL